MYKCGVSEARDKIFLINPVFSRYISCVFFLSCDKACDNFSNALQSLIGMIETNLLYLILWERRVD